MYKSVFVVKPFTNSLKYVETKEEIKKTLENA